MFVGPIWVMFARVCWMRNNVCRSDISSVCICLLKQYLHAKSLTTNRYANLHLQTYSVMKRFHKWNLESKFFSCFSPNFISCHLIDYNMLPHSFVSLPINILYLLNRLLHVAWDLGLCFWLKVHHLVSLCTFQDLSLFKSIHKYCNPKVQGH